MQKSHLPPAQKAIGSKWGFRIKRDKNENVEKFKSRLVAQGCGQKFGVNCWQTYLTVIRYKTIRILLAIAGFQVECSDYKKLNKT